MRRCAGGEVPGPDTGSMASDPDDAGCARCGLMLSGWILVLGLAAASESAGGFEGQQTDPVGDSVITPASGRELRAWGSDGRVGALYDRTSASSAVTFMGDLLINWNRGNIVPQRTHLVHRRCGWRMRVLVASSDLTFTGETHSGSAGGVRLGRLSCRARSTSRARRCSRRRGSSRRLLGVGARRPRRPVRTGSAGHVDQLAERDQRGRGRVLLHRGRRFDPPPGTTPPPPVAPSAAVSAQSAPPDPAARSWREGSLRRPPG